MNHISDLKPPDRTRRDENRCSRRDWNVVRQLAQDANRAHARRFPERDPEYPARRSLDEPHHRPIPRFKHVQLYRVGGKLDLLQRHDRQRHTAIVVVEASGVDPLKLARPIE